MVPVIWTDSPSALATSVVAAEAMEAVARLLVERMMDDSARR